MRLRLHNVLIDSLNTCATTAITTPTSVRLEPLFLAGPVLDGGVVEGGVEHHDGEGENVGRVLRLKHTPVRLDVLCRKDLWRACRCSVEQVYVRDTCVIDAHRLHRSVLVSTRL